MASEPRMVEATTTVMEVDFGNRHGPTRGQLGQLGPAAPDLNESAEPIGVFPEASEAEPEEARPPRRWAGILLALLAVGAFGGVVWFAYKWGLNSGYRDEVPTLMADARPIKVKPENPGGMVVPNQDKMVLHQTEEGGEQPVERLLSEPEVPVPLEPAEGMGPEIASVTDTATEAEAEASAGQPATPAAVEAEAPAAPPEPTPAETVETTAAAPEPTQAPAAKPEPEQPAAPTVAASKPVEATTAPAAGGAASAGAAAGQAAGGASGAASGGAGGGTTLAQVAGVQVAAIQKGDYVIQLASVTSSDAASKEWSRLQKTFPSLLGDMALSVQQATVNGTLYHRVQTGPFPSRATAQDMCAQIKAKNQACIVQRR